MGIFDGCLLISDIDGTLMHKGVIPKNNLDAIEWFKSEGGVFTIATGRQAGAALESYNLVNANAPLIAVQGGVIYDCNENKVLSQVNLNPEIFNTVFDILNKFPTIGCEVCGGVEACLLKENIGTRWHSEYESI
ncbi:MAG: HAD family phosphatase, partial [Clostridia bacterium]|nr:HAD family phosphatase [Clostridia bacterium]